MSKLEKIGDFLDNALPAIAIAHLAIMGIIVIIVAICGVITYPKHEAMKAQCSSIEGTYYGGGKCYKDGKEIDNE